jgi:hypothetical protein
MGQLCILDSSGDTKLIWDEADADSVAASREMFDKLKAKGHIAYSVSEEGKPAQIISAFDPKLGKIILKPLARGG